MSSGKWGLSEPSHSEARMRSLIRDGAGNPGESTYKVPNSGLPFPSPVIFTKPQILGITMAVIWIRKITFRLDSNFRVPAFSLPHTDGRDGVGSVNKGSEVLIPEEDRKSQSRANLKRPKDTLQ